MKFIFYRQGKPSGPFTIEQLKELAKNRVIGPETMLISDTGYRGKAKQLPGLFPPHASSNPFDGCNENSLGTEFPPFPQDHLDAGAGFSDSFNPNLFSADSGTEVTPSPSFENSLPPLDDMNFSAQKPQANSFSAQSGRPGPYCTNCGKPVNPKAIACTYCGASPTFSKNYCRTCGTIRRPEQIVCLKCGCSFAQAGSGFGETGSPKSRITAALLALLLGGIGIQKFYMGSWGWGIIFVVVGLLTWGVVTGIASLVDGIMWLCMSDEAFAAKYPPGTESPMRY